MDEQREQAQTDQPVETPNPETEAQATTEPTNPDPYGLDAQTDSQDAASAESQPSEADSNAERTYTQSEVNEQVKKHLQAFEEHANATLQQIQQKASQNQNADSSQTELSDAQEAQAQDVAQSNNMNVEQVREALKQIQQEEQQKQQQQHVEQRRQQFADQINQARQQYSDYDDLVVNNPKIGNDPMLLEAAAGTDDPGRFLYALAKHHPNDLDQLAKIQDPYKKMTEVGRIEERLKLNANKPSDAPQPLTQDSDGYRSAEQINSIDDRLRLEEQRFQDQMRGMKARG